MNNNNNNNNIIATLYNLSPIFGPSTREQYVQQKLIELLPSEVEGDALGNLWTQSGVDSAKLRCAIVAHADEIGIQIVSIEEPGIARFRKIGGMRATSLIGSRLKFINSRKEEVIGIIGSDPMQNNGTDNGLLIKTSDLWVDIGAKSKSDFEKQLGVGDFGVFDTPGIIRLSEDRLSGKAFDDRLGLAIGIEAFKNLHDNCDLNLIFVSTVQEELNLFGAKALPIDVDIAIVLDVDFSSDTPSDIADSTNLILGQGVGICLSADSSSVLIDIVRNISTLKKIPIQFTTGRNFSGGTDAAALRLKRATSTIVLSIPLRYMHTSHEVVDVNDINNVYSLLVELIKEISNLDSHNLIPWKRSAR